VHPVDPLLKPGATVLTPASPTRWSDSGSVASPPLRARAVSLSAAISRLPALSAGCLARTRGYPVWDARAAVLDACPAPRGTTPAPRGTTSHTVGHDARTVGRDVTHRGTWRPHRGARRHTPWDMTPAPC